MSIWSVGSILMVYFEKLADKLNKIFRANGTFLNEGIQSQRSMLKKMLILCKIYTQLYDIMLATYFILNQWPFQN